MYILTGAAGFIGSNLLHALNAKGIEDIILVDNLNKDSKKHNLANTRYHAYYDKKDFLAVLPQLQNISAILHQGACSSTTETDENYLHQNNVAYSKTLLDYAIAHQIPFIYASSAAVYGDGKLGFSDTSNAYFPINGYANSKLSFDQHVTHMLQEKNPLPKIIGLRYFNVYGYGEAHKEHMSSVIYKFYQSYLNNKEITLFEGSDQILRDFIHVEDIVKVNLFFLENQVPNGIYNVGTGKAASFLALAEAFKTQYTDAIITTIPFPEILKHKYQYFTEADISRLRAAGYQNSFQNIGEAVPIYLNKLRKNA